MSGLSLDIAEQLLDGVLAESQQRSVAMGMAVVAAAGHIVAARRMDGAQFVAVDLAIGKAYTAAAFGHPTERWAQASAPGGSDWGLSTLLSGRLVVFAGACRSASTPSSSAVSASAGPPTTSTAPAR